GGSGRARPAGSAAARAAISEGGIDGVLLDIRLKDGNGLDLLEELRQTHPSLPVIMATAYGDSDRTIEAMRLGAFEYLTKPFDLDRLLDALKRAVKTPTLAEAFAAEPPDEGPRKLIGSRATQLCGGEGRA